MLHTKFKGHHSFGSREEDFLRFLPYMGMAAILVMWPGPFEQIFVPHPIEAPYEIWLRLAWWFLRRGCLKSVDDRQRRQTPTYPISSPVSLWLRWASKDFPIWCNVNFEFVFIAINNTNFSVTSWENVMSGHHFTSYWMLRWAILIEYSVTLLSHSYLEVYLFFWVLNQQEKHCLWIVAHLKIQVQT